MNELLITALITLTVGALSFFVGKKNARTNEFKELVGAYQKICDEMRQELTSAKTEISSLRLEIAQCYQTIQELRAELARYEDEGN